MSTARVDTTVIVPKISEFHISHLNENLYHGFDLIGYDALGDRLLSDQIGCPMENLAPFSQINVRFPELQADATGVLQWSRAHLVWRRVNLTIRQKLGDLIALRPVGAAGEDGP
jgi:hypothetical protein